MNQILELDKETIKLLWRIYRDSKKYQVRQRAHAIILINKGYKILQVADIFAVSRKTIYNWQNNWFEGKFTGLYNQTGTGRKEIFNNSQKRQIRDWSKKYYRNLAILVTKAEEKWGIKASQNTIKRILEFVKIKLNIRIIKSLKNSLRISSMDKATILMIV